MHKKKYSTNWAIESQNIYFDLFVPEDKNNKFLISNKTFSNNALLDCLESETESVVYIADLFKKNTVIKNTSDFSIAIIGSGSGKLGVQIRNLFPNITIFEVDKNKTVVNRLVKKHKNDSFRKTILAEAHELPFKDHSINALICYSVFRYIENADQVLEEFKRVVKIDGTIIVSEAKHKEEINKIEKKLKTIDKILYQKIINKAIELPHVTYFYYLLEKYKTNSLIKKAITSFECKEKKIVKKIFEFAGSSFGSIYSLIWKNK